MLQNVSAARAVRRNVCIDEGPGGRFEKPGSTSASDLIFYLGDEHGGSHMAPNGPSLPIG